MVEQRSRQSIVGGKATIKINIWFGLTDSNLIVTGFPATPIAYIRPHLLPISDQGVVVWAA